MIILGRPPVAQRLDRRHDAAAEILVGAGDRLARLAVLLVALREDRRAILGADVIALAIELRRVVGREEDIQQIVVAELLRIEGDPDRFGVAGVAAAYLLIGGAGDRAAGVAAF